MGSIPKAHWDVPVIAGLSDTSEKLNDDQIGKVMDFCANVFDPSVGIDNLISVRRRYNPEYSTLSGPILSSEDIDRIAPGDDEARKVITKMNALKVLRAEADYSALEEEGLNGFVAQTTRGQLGLRKLKANANVTL